MSYLHSDVTRQVQVAQHHISGEIKPMFKTWNFSGYKKPINRFQNFSDHTAPAVAVRSIRDTGVGRNLFFSSHMHVAKVHPFSHTQQ